MRILKRMIYGNTSKTMVVKRNAHLCTLLAAIWVVFSFLGVFFFRTSRGPEAWIGVTVAVVIWCLHAVFIGLSVYFWITEKPKEVPIIETEADIGF